MLIEYRRHKICLLIKKISKFFLWSYIP